MSSPPFFDAATLNPQEFRAPDNVATVWPQPHDAKLDVIEMLRGTFAQLGLTDIAVSKDGAFTAAALTNASGASVPYVTVTRSADIAGPSGIGNLIATFAAGNPTLVDPAAIVPPGSAVAVHGEFSNTTIDITIADKDAFRADQLFIVIKLLMQAARPEFNKIGYTQVKRLNGTDGAPVQVDSPFPYLVFIRTLTYSLEYPDYIANVDTLVMLIKQSLVFDPSPGASITTNI